MSVHPRLRSVRLLPIALIVALTTGAGKVYRWVDANGRAHYGDAPPAAAQTQELAPAVKTPKADEDADKKAAEDAAKACQQARDTLASYNSAAKITQVDATGTTRELSDEDRKKLIDAEQAKVSKNCPPDNPRS